MEIRYEKKKYCKKGNWLSSNKTGGEKYKKGVRSRQEEMEICKNQKVMIRYNKLCDIMKEEVCKATGKRYGKDGVDRENQDKMVKKNKREGAKRVEGKEKTAG